MNTYSLKDISNYIGGNLIGQDRRVSNFSIDSRTINENEVFICIKGNKYDGHQFIQDSLKKASCIVSSRNIPEINLQNKSYIKVQDTYKSLHMITEYIRQKSKAKFIAITGSNGKTTVKEMLAHVLSDFQITFTKGNLNNHIGVPLTIFSTNQNDDYVIVEIGANGLNEIGPLAKIIKPDIAAVTNVGYAHIEGFGSLDNTAKEKYSIFEYLQNDGIAVINNDDNYTKYISKKNKFFFGNNINFKKKLIQRAKNFPCETYFSDISKIKEKQFKIKHKEINEIFSLKLNGDHNFLNAACVISISLALGIDIDFIKKKIESFESVSSRLKIHSIYNNITLIDDCYNANPSSFKAALSFLSYRNQKKLVLMGDMVELGEETENFHAEIGSYAKKMGIDEFLSIGKNSEAASSIFGKNGHHFNDAESLKSYLNNNIESSSCILVKGSRKAKLEEYVDFLKKRK